MTHGTSQLRLFDQDPQAQAQVEAVVARVNRFTEAGAVEPVMDAPSERLFEAFASAVLAVLSAPGCVPGLSPLHGQAVGMERTLRLLDALQEAQAIQAQGAMETAWTHLVNRFQADERRLTDREVCLLFVEVSLEVGPMNQWATEEYYRAFVASYGPVMGLAVLGEPFRPLRYDLCFGLRQFSPKLSQRLPRITPEGIEALNRKMKGVLAWQKNETPPQVS